MITKNSRACAFPALWISNCRGEAGTGQKEGCNVTPGRHVVLVRKGDPAIGDITKEVVVK